MSKKIVPIKPEEIIFTVPDYVITAVNQLLKEQFVKRSVVITQEEVVKRIMDITGKTRTEVFAEADKGHILDFEDTYRQFGWDVAYDKPGYNETYPASFKFTVKN